MHHGCYWQRMESERSGDLGDIVRSGGVCTDRDLSSENRCSEAFDFRREGPSTSTVPEAKGFPPPLQQFSAPLPSLPDPLLPESVGPVSYEGVDMSAPALYGGQNGLLAAHTAVEEKMCRRPCDMLSRVLQISPAMRAATSPPGHRGIQPPPPVLLGNAVNLNNPAVPDGATIGQIPSPRSQGIKRRKSQAKKVVCIPAPANTGSRQSGEVVPSDLWAWRKYGQKPIKGSPYPRGYYRCSSSKGCSARKQVERSRTDPNMLVITYTSEHNHPWPTHRNALAGSTRSHPSKIPSSSNTSRSTSMIDIPRAEHVESTSSACSSEQSAVKEEASDHIDQTTAKEPHGSEQPEHVFRQPAHSDDQHLFADLGELGPDPMNLLFSKEFLGDRLDEEMGMGKALDPFSLFDWDGDSFDSEANKGDL